MAKLILSLDGTVLREITLVKERTSIGRRPHNDIQIDNLAISGEHALLLSDLDDVFLQDLDSTNGTTVNGQPVIKQLLADGDVIGLGKYRLKYFAETPRLPPAQLRVDSGAHAGQLLQLSKARSLIGKTGVQVAAIARRSHGYFIAHVEGSQTPLLNGEPLGGSEKQLADADQIDLAGVKMTFVLKG